MKRDESRNQGRPPKVSGNSHSVARIENKAPCGNNNPNTRSQSKPAKDTSSLKVKEEPPSTKAIIPKKKEIPSSKTDPPHKTSKAGTPTNNKKPEDIKALDHKEPLKIAEVRESKQDQVRKEFVQSLVKVEPIAKEKQRVESPVEEPVEDSKDIEVEEEEVPALEASYQEDFNDSLGGGGIEQSSKLNIKKGSAAGDLSEHKNPEAKKEEEVSKTEHEQDKSIISNTS